jgi:hypothetical protein
LMVETTVPPKHRCLVSNTQCYIPEGHNPNATCYSRTLQKLHLFCEVIWSELSTKDKVIVEDTQTGYKYSKNPSLMWLQLIWIEIWKIKKVHSWVHGIYEGRWVTQLFTQNLSVSSHVHYYVQKQVQLLSLLSMNK